MGAGKSTVAKVLSSKTGMQVIEMDQAISDHEGMSIPQIFKEKGESYFRQLETDMIKSFGSNTGFIVSCGGGVPLREINVEYMKKAGTTFLLTAEPETILERVKDDTNRPLLNGHMNVEYISDLMEQRRPKYEACADFAVSTDGKTAEVIADEILGDMKIS